MDNNKELNFVGVCAAIGKSVGRFCTWCLKALVWSLRFLYRRKWAALAFLLAGAIWGVYSYRSDNSCKVGFYLTSQAEQARLCIDRVNDLDRYVQNGNLNKALPVGEDIAAQVKKIEACHVVDMWHDDIIDKIDRKGAYASDTIVNPWSKKFFYVELSLDDESAADTICRAIIGKLSQDPILHTYWAERQKFIQSWMDMLDKEIETMSAVEEKLYSLDNPALPVNVSNGKLTLIGENRVQVFSVEKNRLQRYKMIHLDELTSLNRGVVTCDLPFVYNGLEKSQAAEIVKGMVLGLIVCFVLCLLFANWKRIIEFLQKEA